MFSKNIQREEEIAFHFGKLLAEDSDLKWRLLASSEPDCDAVAELEINGKTWRFAVKYELLPTVASLRDFSAQKGSLPLLLVTPELSARIIALCKQEDIAAIDLNGRVWLRASGLLVDRQALPGRRFRYAFEPGNIFTGKSVRIVRSLLADRTRVWTQTELAARTQTSGALVSRISRYLIRQGFVERTSARQLRVCDYLGLVDAWARADRLAKRVHTVRYAGFIGQPQELAHKLQDWAREHSVSVAFTQWLAAWCRVPYADVLIAAAYVSRLPSTAELEALGLYPVDDGGQLWLHVPDDEGLFLETQVQKDLTLTTDAQIYVDLQQSPLRGPDQARALRDWENFCKS